MSEVPDSLLFELLGRKEVALELQRRHIQEMGRQLRAASAPLEPDEVAPPEASEDGE